MYTSSFSFKELKQGKDYTNLVVQTITGREVQCQMEIVKQLG